MKRFFFRWGAALGLMLLIFLVSSQPKSNIRDFGLWDLLLKKGGHLLGYALLSMAMWRGVRGSEPPGWRHFARAFALTLLYALSDEYHQAFVPGRGGNLWDVGVDALGATIGLTLHWRRSARLRPLAVPSPSKSEPNRR